VSGFNVMSIVLQIPKDAPDGRRRRRDGRQLRARHSTRPTERLMTRTINGDGTVSVSGPEVQVSRLGHPLVNELVIGPRRQGQVQRDEAHRRRRVRQLRDESRTARPVQRALWHPGAADAAQRSRHRVPDRPAGLNSPRTRIRFACEMLRSQHGDRPRREPEPFRRDRRRHLAGFPNGRRLADDVVDIEERVAAGILVPGFNNAPREPAGGRHRRERQSRSCPTSRTSLRRHNPLNTVHGVEQKVRRSRAYKQFGDEFSATKSARARRTRRRESRIVARARILDL
jgi:hypothetical protein